MKIIKFLVQFLFFMTYGISIAHAGEFGSGAIDILKISEDGSNRISITGWYGANNPSVYPAYLEVYVGKEKAWSGKFERFNRPDVVAATKNELWIKSGISVIGEVNYDIKPGIYMPTVYIILSNGDKDAIALNSTITDIRVVKRQSVLNMNIDSLLFLLTIILSYVAYRISARINFLNGEAIGEVLSQRIKLTLFSTWIFALLVTFGVTGSSIGLLYQTTDIAKLNLNRVALKERDIRSDEYLSVTPSALAQYNHQPRFPVTNTNLGPDGQNMLVIGMASVPVNHISTIGKPSTWGFFVFDLKRALSWYWFYPIFSCFIALVLLLNMGFELGMKQAILLSLAFVFSPYVVAWSMWPAYSVSFPLIALLCLIVINKCESKLSFSLVTIILWSSISGFILLLYPPYQISIGYVSLAILFILVKNKKIILTRKLFASLLASVIMSAITILIWYTDAKDAIDLITNTVYPGRRVNLVGGGMSLWEVFKGYSNFTTMYGGLKTSNESEIASFFYLIIPSLVLIVLSSTKDLSLLKNTLPFIILLVIIYIYSFIGLPSSVSYFTLFGRVPISRFELALGFINIFLIAQVLVFYKKRESASRSAKLIALLITLLYAILILNSLSRVKGSLGTFDLNGLMVLYLFFAGLVIYEYIKKSNLFLYVFMAINFIATIAFNPIVISSGEVVVNQSMGDYKVSGARVLFLDNYRDSIAMYSAGAKVVSGIYYYPQFSIWNDFELNEASTSIVNRYQHFMVNTGLDIDGSFSIASPQADVVILTINPRLFDFKKITADIVVAPKRFEDLYLKNEHLTYVGSNLDRAIFKVNK